MKHYFMIVIFSAICLDLINEANTTKCGHSFCQKCIIKALENTSKCPLCNTPCSIVNDIYPSFTCKYYLRNSIIFCFLNSLSITKDKASY